MQVLVYDIVGVPDHILPNSSRLILQFQQRKSTSTVSTGQIHVSCNANRACTHSRINRNNCSLVRTRAVATSYKKISVDKHTESSKLHLKPKHLQLLLGSQHCVIPYSTVRVSIESQGAVSICNHMTCKIEFSGKGGSNLQCHVVLPISLNPLNNISLRPSISQDGPACFHGTWTIADGMDGKSADQSSLYTARRLRRKVVMEKSFRLVSAEPVLELKPGIYRFHGWASREGDYLLAMINRDLTSRPHQHLDECIGSVELLRNGTLRGFSCESCSPQICDIRGTWKPRRVQFELSFSIVREVGKFIYDGRVRTDPTTMAIYLGGYWRNIDDQENLLHAGYRGGRGHFVWNMVSIKSIDRPSRNPCSSSFIPELTPGEFVLRGNATDSDGYEYPEILTLQLFPGGTLQGRCTQLLFSEQECKVSGKWSANTLKYTLSFSLRNMIGNYQYILSVAPDGMGVILRGRWWNVASEDLLHIGEQGASSFTILKAKRYWDRCCDDYFPKSFRQVSAWLLRPSNIGCYRSPWPANRYYRMSSCSKLCHPPMINIPAIIWHNVLSFCHEEWFQPDDAI